MDPAFITTEFHVAALDFDAWTTAAVTGPGDVAPVVLLHGFPQSKASWAPVLSALGAANVPAVAFDQRGYSAGARPTAVTDYTIDHLMSDVLGVCDELGWNRVHLVGHDWGAIVAWNLAARHPDRVTSLVAVSVPHPAAFAWAIAHDPDQRERSAYMNFLAADATAADLLTAEDGAALRLGFGDAVAPDLVDEHLRVLLPDSAMEAALNWYRAADALGAVPAVTCPTTFLWGSADIAIGRAAVQRCHEFVTGAFELRELTDISHWVPEQDPAAVADAVARHRSREVEETR